MALDASRADRQHVPKPDTEYCITAPNGEERIVRYRSVAADPSCASPTVKDGPSRFRDLPEGKAA